MKKYAGIILFLAIVFLCAGCATAKSKEEQKDVVNATAAPVEKDLAVPSAAETKQAVAAVKKASKKAAVTAVKQESAAEAQEKAPVAKIEAAAPVAPEKPESKGGSFPWWIIIVLALLAAVIIFIAAGRKKDEGVNEPKFGQYTPPGENVTRAPNPSVNPPQGMPSQPPQPAQSNMQQTPPPPPPAPYTGSNGNNGNGTQQV